MYLRRLLPVFVAILLPVIVLLLLLHLHQRPLQAAAAGTLLVTKTEDTADGICDADCSLREAVDAANNNPGPDTINLPAGTYRLSLMGLEDNNAGGDLDSRDTVTLLGAGPDATVIDANDLDRAVHAITGSLTISGVTVINGQDLSGSGGGGILATGDVMLTSANIVSNVANLDGGGLAVFGSLTLSDTLFQENESLFGRGGGVFISGTAVLQYSEFLSNTANDDGGGLYLYVTTATLTSSGATPTAATQAGINYHRIVARYNQSTGGNGGGLALVDGGTNFFYTVPQSFLDFDASDNEALQGCGGGLYASEVNIDLSDSILARNIAQRAGAVCISNNELIKESLRQFRIYRSTFQGNTTFYGVGAVAAENVDSDIAYNKFCGNGLNHLGLLGEGNVRNNFFLYVSPLAPMTVLDARAGGQINFINNSLYAEPAPPAPFPTTGISAGGAGKLLATNNIIDGVEVAMERGGTGPVVEDYNLFSMNTITPTVGGVDSGGHSFTGETALVDPASCDLHLTADSDAIDAGSDTDLTDDLDGDLRPQDGDGDGTAAYDIGADEYNASTVKDPWQLLLPVLRQP